MLPGKANTIAGRHRPFHTIIPAFLEKGDIKIGFGIMGGANQPQAHAQFVSNIVDHGMNIQEALAAARFRHMTIGKCDVNIETRVAPKVIDDLKAMGHVMKPIGSFSPNFGMGHAVMLDGKGVKYAAADPRWDGEAVPQAPPVFKK
jgi:gamma-glutamyltranspeptidase/glutathione hydrolase